MQSIVEEVTCKERYVQLLLEKSLEHLESAGREQSARNDSQARWHYLKAAKCLFQAAAQSTGPLRDLRRDKAEQLLAAARRLESPTTTQRQRAEAAAADEPSGSFLLRESSEVRFGDVAGLEEAKEQIRLRLIYPLEHPEKAARYGIRRGGGLLLYGPPGTGKTLLARAVAGEVNAAFFTARPSELMSKWVGESEQNIARLFDEARQCPRAVIFLDEIEAMLPARRSSGSTVMQRVVPQILAELQGVRGRQGSLLFLGATNEPWAIDPAALRPGRFDAKVFIGLPELAARRRMLELYLAGRPLAADLDLDRLAESLAGYSGADIAELCDRASAKVFLHSIRDGEDRPVIMEDLRIAAASLPPSVTSLELEKYRLWQSR